MTLSRDPLPRPRPGPGRWVIGLGIALLCLIWGTTWLVIRVGLEDLPPFTSAALRFVGAALILTLIAPRLSRIEGGARPTLRLSVVMGIYNIALPYLIVYWSETVLPSGLVSLLWAVFPMMIGVLGHFRVPGEQLARRQWAGIALGFLGVMLLFVTDLPSIGPGAIGVGLVLLLSPAISAVGNLSVKLHGAGTSSVLLNRNGMWIGALVVVLVAFGTESDVEMRWSPAAIASIAYLTVFGTVIAFGLYFWLLRYAPAYQLSMVAYIVPVVSLSVGALWGGETITAFTISGALLVLGGVALVLRGRKRPQVETYASEPEI